MCEGIQRCYIFSTVSPDVLKLCKFYNAVRVELLLLLDLIELSANALGAAPLPIMTLTLPVAVDLLDKRGGIKDSKLPAAAVHWYSAGCTQVFNLKSSKPVRRRLRLTNTLSDTNSVWSSARVDYR